MQLTANPDVMQASLRHVKDKTETTSVKRTPSMHRVCASQRQSSLYAAINAGKNVCLVQLLLGIFVGTANNGSPTNWAEFNETLSRVGKF